MPSEVTVKIKEEDTTLSEKFLEYEPFRVSFHDPILKGMIDTVMGRFKQTPLDPEIKVKINILDG